jgi:hypothetical protein
MATREDAAPLKDRRVDLPPMAEDHRSPAEIRRDMERERHEIDVVTDELGRRLAPAHVAGQIWDDVQPRLGQGRAAMVDGLRSHPVPAALLAAGLGWLVVELATGDSVTLDGARDEAESVVTAASVQVGAAAEKSGAAVRQLGQELGEGARSAWSSVARAARLRPFALGTVVLGTGILTGIALPMRRRQPPL